MKIVAVIEKANAHSYSCCAEKVVSNCLLVGYGNTARAAMADFCISYEELKRMNAREGKETPNLEFEYRFDVGSLFNYYSFLNIEGMANIIGISSAVLRQYASGVRKPRKEQMQKIQDGVRKAATQIQRVMLNA